MTPLRTKMIEAMQVRGFSQRTHESYLAAVSDLARFHHRSPEQLGIEDIERSRLPGHRATALRGQLPGVSVWHSVSVSAGAEVAGIRRCHPDAEEGTAHCGAAHAYGGGADRGRLHQPQVSHDAHALLWLWAALERAVEREGARHRRGASVAAHRTGQGSEGSSGAAVGDVAARSCAATGASTGRRSGCLRAERRVRR